MSRTTHPIIPEDERRCIWMDAGIASYHLCDHQFQCDACSFDAQIRMQRPSAVTNAASSAAQPARLRRETPILAAQTAEELCASTLNDLVRSITAADIPSDRAYTSNHTWAKKEKDGSYTIGVDHFIGAMLSGVHSVACSLPSTHVGASEPCAWIVAGGETLAVRAPLSGTVLACNTALAGASDTLHADPYTQGWIARIRPDRAQWAAALLCENEMTRVMAEDCRRYQSSINAELGRMQAQLEGTMYDGGTVLENFEDILGSKKYYEIVECFLRP